MITFVKKLDISRVRGDTFGYLQRSFAGCISEVDAREAFEVGETAIQRAIYGDDDCSITIRRVGDYAAQYHAVPLAAVAAKTRTMPDKFINKKGNDITHAFRDYLRPLLGSNLPVVHRLHAMPVAKRLS